MGTGWALDALLQAHGCAACACACASFPSGSAFSSDHDHHRRGEDDREHIHSHAQEEEPLDLVEEVALLRGDLGARVWTLLAHVLAGGACGLFAAGVCVLDRALERTSGAPRSSAPGARADATIASPYAWTAAAPHLQPAHADADAQLCALVLAESPGVAQRAAAEARRILQLDAPAVRVHAHASRSEEEILMVPVLTAAQPLAALVHLLVAGAPQKRLRIGARARRSSSPLLLWAGAERLQARPDAASAPAGQMHGGAASASGDGLGFVCRNRSGRALLQPLPMSAHARAHPLVHAHAHALFHTLLHQEMPTACLLAEMEVMFVAAAAHAPSNTFIIVYFL